MGFEFENDAEGLEPTINESALLDGPGIEIEEIDDSPATLATPESTKVRLRNFKQIGEARKEYLPANFILTEVLAQTNGWPKSVSGLLVVQESNEKFRTLKDSNDFFAWLHRVFDLEWGSGSGISKAEFFKYAVDNCERYEYWSEVPHYPPIPGVLYSPKNYPNEGGAALNEFLCFFCPATHLDAGLIRAMALTLFWGGPAGQRPAFLLTTQDNGPNGGVGFGKTTLATKLAELAGGFISASPSESYEAVTKRILSPVDGKAGHRIVLLDNIKTLRLSDSGLEGMITTGHISGHRMYGGHATVPNYFTVFLTLNGAALSRDLASRCIPIFLAQAPKSQQWLANLNAFVAAKRELIIGDIALLLDSQGTPLPDTDCTRWASWENGVLSKVGLAGDCRQMILSRQANINDDASDANEFLQHILYEIKRLSYHVNEYGNGPIATISLNSMGKFYEEFFGKKVGSNKLSKVINLMGIRSLFYHKEQGKRRLFLLRRDCQAITDDDIEAWKNE